MYAGNTLYFGRVNLCRRTLRVANLSMTLWCSILSSNSFSMDITARCWSLLWPVVLLSHVWSRRKALKDRSHVQLLTGIVKATCITAFSEGNISESRSLYTASMSWTVPASLLRFLLLHLSLFPLTLTIIHKYIVGRRVEVSLSCQKNVMETIYRF